MNQQNNKPINDTAAVRDLNLDMPLPPVAPVAKDRTRPVFTGMEDHSITLSEAGSLTRNYRMAAGRGAVKGRFFSRVSLEQLLMQEGVVGIRYYYAEDNNGRQQMVLVGVDAQGKDLTEGFLIGNGLPVSRFHEQANQLNT
ncbi:MAG: hypothetical protein C0600_07150 [Ignavibacteria bacterium]|nr:MAG: hypothetical protein C0600_07150 [Ignavibacteria bacterium]